MLNAIDAPLLPPASNWSKPLRATLLALLFALTMTSCAHGTHPTASVPAELLALLNPVPPLGPDLTAPCPTELPPAIDPTLAGLGRNHLQVVAIYFDCESGKARLAAAARERERIEAERIERARQALERVNEH